MRCRRRNFQEEVWSQKVGDVGTLAYVAVLPRSARNRNADRLAMRFGHEALDRAGYVLQEIPSLHKPARQLGTASPPDDASLDGVRRPDKRHRGDLHGS